MSYAVAAIIIGLIELFFGRSLFWLFVAIAGFGVGWLLIPDLFPTVSGWLRILAGVALGLIFGLLAVVFLRVMVAIAGFFIFGGAAVLVARELGATIESGSGTYWVLYLIVGFIGAIVLFAFLDWALIVLTSLAGAAAVARGIFYLAGGPRWAEWVLFAALAVLGIVFQAWRYAGSAPLGRRRRPIASPG